MAADTPDTRPVLFIDSGIGGIPYCRYFRQRNPGERVVYLADRRNFPYGKRGRDELIGLLCGLVARAAAACNPKIIVLACNTATVSALAALRTRFPQIPFVGTVPALKPAMLASATGTVGLLGTERTVEDPYIAELAGELSAQTGGTRIHAVAAPALVELVESRIDSVSAGEKQAASRQWLQPFRRAGADALVLGCTHFLFLLDEFRREAAPDIQIFESLDGICRRVETLLGSARGDGGDSRLLLTGTAPIDGAWQRRAAELGCACSLLEEPCGD